jgi:hypothetical protein
MLTATVLAGAATFPMAGVALAQDRDCPDFTSQQDAQSALDTSPYDDERLDADGDRIACEDHFDDGDGDGSDPDDSSGGHDSDDSDDSSDSSGGSDSDDSDDGEAPVGSVETGGGGTAGGPGAAAPLALAGASTLVIGGVLVAARRTGRQRG